MANCVGRDGKNKKRRKKHKGNHKNEKQKVPCISGISIGKYLSK